MRSRHNHARRQFQLYLGTTLCWAFCSIVRLIEILTGKVPQSPWNWFFLVVVIANAVLNADLCLRNWKRMKKEDV